MNKDAIPNVLHPIEKHTQYIVAQYDHVYEDLQTAMRVAQDLAKKHGHQYYVGPAECLVDTHVMTSVREL